MSRESAIFVNRIATLDDVEREYTRVYFGNEFCDRRMPRPDHLREAHRHASANGLDFTWVTPLVSDSGVDMIKSRIDYLSDILDEIEVVFNDWGIYHLFQRINSSPTLVAGRLLNGQKRGPGILHLESQTDEDRVFDHFKKSTINVSQARSMLEDIGVDRLELDVLLQGMEEENTGFSASVYYPWNYVTLRRWCQELHSDDPVCGKQCDPAIYQLDNQPAMPAPLFRRMNVIFTHNEEIPDRSYIDREVFLPDPIV